MAKLMAIISSVCQALAIAGHLFIGSLDIERGASASEPGKTGEALNRMAEGNAGGWIFKFRFQVG